MLHKVYYPNISKVTELRRFFTKRAFCNQYYKVIEHSNHSLYTENTYYEEHTIHIPSNTILRDKVSIRKIIYPIPDEHIAVILCILSVLYMSKCCIKHVIQAFPK